jgi:hypothetical protein
LTGSHEILYEPEIEGFGTTYEAVHSRQMLYKFVKERHVRQVCEYPICTFRIPGIVSAYLAAADCEVTLATTDQTTLEKAKVLFKRCGLTERARFVRIGTDRLESNSFDMIFHMSLLSTIERDLGIEPVSCVREMARLSRKWVLVTNHNLHYSVFLDRAISGLRGSPTQFGDQHLVGERPVRRIFRKVGLTIRDEFLFDIPPWPALDISRFASEFRRRTTKGIANSTNETIEQTMRKYSFIESSALPRWIKTIFAHHVGIVGVKSPPDDR